MRIAWIIVYATLFLPSQANIRVAPLQGATSVFLCPREMSYNDY